MRVEAGLGERAPAPKRAVPCMQTAWPHMLVPRPSAAVPLVFPFDQPGLRYRYFARNAVWDAVQLLELSGKQVPVPNGGALLARGRYRDELHRLAEVGRPGWPSTESHVLGSLLSNLERRTGPVGGPVRDAVRGSGHWLVRKASVERVSTGTQ